MFGFGSVLLKRSAFASPLRQCVVVNNNNKKNGFVTNISYQLIKSKHFHNNILSNLSFSKSKHPWKIIIASACTTTCVLLFVYGGLPSKCMVYNNNEYNNNIVSSFSYNKVAFCLDDDDENPFIYEELTKGINLREEREKELLKLRAKARHRVFLIQQRAKRGELNEQQFRIEMKKLQTEINAETQRIVFGVDKDQAHARETYLQLYGCVKWTDEVLQEISTHAPLVEIGAGNGQWKRELETKYKVDIIAYDNETHLPLNKKEYTKTEILMGDETSLKNHKNRTLLLVCPPPTDMATNCLKNYRGERIVYVGEGIGGAHADKEFFKQLEKYWQVEKVLKVDCFNECYEKCYILKRKPSRFWPFY